MNQLTQEQIKTLEDAFATFPEDVPKTSKYIYTTMKGIEEQLQNPRCQDDGKKYILYMKQSSSDPSITGYTLIITKMFIKETK